MSDPPVPVVLIVEDEVMIRFPIADEFRNCGWHVLEADKGEVAVEALLANHKPNIGRMTASAAVDGPRSASP